MRLITHNMLSSNIKGVTNGFPLRIEVEKLVEKTVEFNPEFLRNMFAKIERKALVEASRTMGYSELPENAEPSLMESDEFLSKFHHPLLELHLEEGALVCPETGHKFPVNRGIHNMLLHEDENPLTERQLNSQSSVPNLIENENSTNIGSPLNLPAQSKEVIRHEYEFDTPYWRDTMRRILIHVIDVSVLY